MEAYNSDTNEVHICWDIYSPIPIIKRALYQTDGTSAGLVQV